jgi:primosomal replication protein N
MSGFRTVHFHARLCSSVLFALLASSVSAQQPQVLLGDTSVESSTDSNPAGTAEAFPVRAAATGQVSSLSVYLDRSNSATSISVGMYADSNGHPGALLTRGATSNALSGGWNQIIISPLPVTSGTTYWLALVGENGVVRFRDRNGRCRSEVDSQTNLSSLPATWSTGSVWRTCMVSMFESGSAAPGSSTPAPSTGLLVSPHTISLLPGHQQQFTAAVNGSNSFAVTWSASGGTVTKTGLYTAPTTAGTYTVTARSGGSRRTSASASASAVVTVASSTSNPPPPAVATAISISPTSSSLKAGATQQFTAAVSGTTNTAVTWSATSGTISSNGLYTAPASSGSYTVTAVSKADSSKHASAVVVVSATQTVAIAISPAKTSVQGGAQLQLTATVSGTSNTAVTWSATSGTISSNGLYTAPAPPGSYTVTAISNADASKQASAVVVVSAPQTVAITISAPKTSVQTGAQLQLTATVSGTSNTAVTWAVTKGSGVIAQSGLYTAPKSAESDVITATSQGDTTKSASVSIAVSAPPPAMSHSVSLQWDASTSTISYYKVYRGTMSGGPYNVVATNITATTYTDSTVQSGTTYYYVTTALNSAGVESVVSNQLPAVIPAP